jgi:hypothetical protein
MIIKTQIAGIFGDTPIMAKGEVELSDNSDLKTFFKKADRALGFSRARRFSAWP